jgi:hypothetical protein
MTSVTTQDSRSALFQQPPTATPKAGFAASPLVVSELPHFARITRRWTFHALDSRSRNSHLLCRQHTLAMVLAAPPSS